MRGEAQESGVRLMEYFFMRLRMQTIVFMLIAASMVAGQEKPAKNSTAPIKVVVLNRTAAVIFDKDIEPILANRCHVCHSGPIKEGQLDLGSYETMIKGGKRGTPIVAGKSADSLLIKLAGKTRKPFMPPKTEEPLTPQELALLKLWIDQGAKAPLGPRAKSTLTLTALPEQVHPVRALSFSPDKKSLAVARANHLFLHDAGSGNLLRTLIDPQLKPLQTAQRTIIDSLAYSPDGKLLASGAFREIVVWNVSTGEIVRRLSEFNDRVVALAFSPDGKWIATGGGAPTEEGEIKLFEAATGKLILNIKNGHSDTVYGVAFSSDGKKLATCGADKFVKVFETPGGKFLKSFEGHTNQVLDVAWKADGKLLVSVGADNAIKVWDYQKGEQVRTFGNHAKQITRIVFKGRTSEIATCSGDQTVRFWNVDTGSNGLTIGGSQDYLYALGMSADGKIVASGGEEGVVRLYNAANGQLLKAIGPPKK
jgi:WD40 repeat protein